MQLTKVPDGEYLLQNAANSVLGKQLIVLCKKRGIKTINLVRWVGRHKVSGHMAVPGCLE